MTSDTLHHSENTHHKEGNGMRDNIKSIVTISSSLISGYIADIFGISFMIKSLLDSTIRNTIYSIIDDFDEYKNYFAFELPTDIEYDNQILYMFIVFLVFTVVSFFLLPYLFRKLKACIAFVIYQIKNTYYFNVFSIYVSKNILNKNVYYSRDIKEVKKILDYMSKYECYIDTSLGNNNIFKTLNSKALYDINKNADTIDSSFLLLQKLNVPATYQRLYIYDKNFNIQGYIYVSEEPIEINVPDKKKQPIGKDGNSFEIIETQRTISIKSPCVKL